MNDDLTQAAARVFEGLERAREQVRPDLEAGEVGRLLEAGGGVAQVAGFTDLAAGELLAFPNGLMGVAESLGHRRTGVMLLGRSDELREGDQVRRTRRVVDVPVGEALLGRVVDALGRPLDDAGEIGATERRPVERPAPPIMARAPVTTPLQTGIKVIDAALPIGRGQRELILGDRQTGKTSVALDAVLAQRDTGVLSVWCAIGQRASAVVRVLERLRAEDALGRCVVVVAGGEDPPGLQFVAPYAAATIAERFAADGEDVLVVFDDLVRHARAYRELSLLMRRPPGREAYPGDVFYIHSRLLERATHLREEEGGGSITALPVVETQAGDISAFIPTNLISITDGQIYLDSGLFERGQLPAVDVGRSVSRVGGKAQLPAFRTVAADLRLAYSQYEELESFSRFGARLDEETQRKLDRGRRVRQVLRQGEGDHLSVIEQISVLLATTSGALDSVATDRVAEAEAAIRAAARERLAEVAERPAAGEKLSEEDREAVLSAVREALAEAGLGEGAEDGGSKGGGEARDDEGAGDGDA